MHVSNIALPAPVPHREECRVNKLPKTIAIKPFFVSTKWLQGNLLTSPARERGAFVDSKALVDLQPSMCEGVNVRDRHGHRLTR